jgi:2-keto-4-pentenoate hydratase/2-oxohepta-3-ene-1,7-dioic acid hydratase in catechol pathway
MRLVTFQLDSPLGPVRRGGVLTADGVIDYALARAALLDATGWGAARAVAEGETPTDVLALLERGPRALDAVHEAVEHVRGRGVDEFGGARVSHPATVRLLAPIPRPRSLRDYLVVEEHLRNARKAEPPPEWFNIPAFYKGNVDAIYGPEDEVPWPWDTEKLDYELEICAVIGRGGRAIPADAAGAHIVGYTIYNDWSARDIQRREMSVGIGPGVGKDFASSIGPCIATPDEFDRDGAALRARVDGEEWSSGVLGKMQFSFEEIIEWTSMATTLHPGDLLGSGTVGHGCGLELDRWLSPGSVVELEAEGIGVLRNRVGHKPPIPDPAPRGVTPTEGSTS